MVRDLHCSSSSLNAFSAGAAKSRSTIFARTWGLAVCISFITLWSAGTLRATRRMLKPARASWSANSRPIPSDAPVTSAQAPSSLVVLKSEIGVPGITKVCARTMSVFKVNVKKEKRPSARMIVVNI